MISNPLGFITGYAPSLNLDFTQGAFPAGLSFSRASAGTYFDSAGILQSAALNVPRLDYDPVTLQAKGLLIEEQRTNLITYSESFSNAIWQKSNVIVTSNATQSPSKIVNADKVQADTTSNIHRAIYSYAFASTGLSATLTVFAKAGGYNFFYLNAGAIMGARATFNLTNGTFVVGAGSASMQNVGDGWYRCSVSGSSATTAQSSIFFQINSTVSNAVDDTFTGNGTSGIHLWGAQLEVGSFPTSYIPTTSAAVTRSQDLCSMNLGSWFNSIQGTLFADFLSNVNGGTSQIAGGIGAGSSNGIHIRINGVNTYGMFRDASATKDGQSVSYTIGSPRRSAVAYNVGTRVGYASGGLLALENSNASNTYELTSSQSWNKLAIGSYADLSQSSLNGWVKTVKYYRNRLPNSLLQSLTA